MELQEAVKRYCALQVFLIEDQGDVRVAIDKLICVFVLQKMEGEKYGGTMFAGLGSRVIDDECLCEISSRFGYYGDLEGMESHFNRNLSHILVALGF
jgi:hypothetical protein